MKSLASTLMHFAHGRELKVRVHVLLFVSKQTGIAKSYTAVVPSILCVNDVWQNFSNVKIVRNVTI